MKRPIIGLTGNLTTDPEGQPISYTPQEFVHAITAVGGVPVILPMGEPELVPLYLATVDKLLLTGGQDVTPQLYGEEPHIKLETTNPTRDYFEQALIKEALAHNLPIFGVCRGLQLLNVTLGGTLYQDLSLYPEWQIKHVQSLTQVDTPTHSVTIEKDSLLAPITGEKLAVTSFHHQAIKTLAPNLTAIAWSADQLIEAVEWQDATQQVLAVQWHPELSFKKQAEARALFHYFVHSF